MLKSLYIKNYALISKLEVDFHSGFSVITGETGAGKSIILGALSLILGQRADSKTIKAGENKCIIEGFFDVKDYDLKSFCESRDIDYDAQSFVLRREITSEGKSRAFINDTPATLSNLKELGEKLIDIHSQHKNLLLGDNDFQLEVLDLLSGSGDVLKEFQTSFKEYKKAERQLHDLLETAQSNKNEEEFIRFQHDSLAEALLKDGEQEELERELALLSHSEEIKSVLFKAYALLSDSEQSIIGNLKEALQSIQSISAIYPTASQMAGRIESAYLDLKDLSPEIERSAENIEFSPERLEFINNRLDLIYGLQQKHRVSSIKELIELFHLFQEKLSSIDSLDEKITSAKKQAEASETKMLALAKKLSEKRLKSKSSIEKTLVEKIASLGMPNVRFECEITPKKFPDNSGGDNLRFLFSANKNVPLQPVSEVASGGEISRVMLCIKSLIAHVTNLPTIIFDEIDTGVSGEVADKMGRIMQEFGDNKQVLAITHLPQIASKGDHHYFVYKSDDEQTSNTSIKLLSKEERTQELAQMLSGSDITEAAMENAKAMLQTNKKLAN
ncbi:MAG: repair protein RecN [Bacteroidetes bacterium]|nr:repair protein RecN [Bacteroidota bacterium]